MELRQIHSFIAVAEELHFRKAAERLGVAQTALSAQIRSLEGELGFELLFRTTRHVSLTQPGAVFLDEVRQTVARLDKAIETARAAANSGLERLRIGGIDAALVWFLPPVINQFRHSYPGLHLPLTEVSASALQVKELLRHRVDVAFFRPPASIEGIVWETLLEEQVMVAVPQHSPLASQPLITAHQLMDERLISYPRHARPYLADMVHSSFDAVGLRPNIELEVLDKSTLLRMVAQDMGVGLVPQWVVEVPTDGVAFVPYSDAPEALKFGVAWRENDKSETLKTFLDITRAEAKIVATRFASYVDKPAS